MKRKILILIMMVTLLTACQAADSGISGNDPVTDAVVSNADKSTSTAGETAFAFKTDETTPSTDNTAIPVSVISTGTSEAPQTALFKAFDKTNTAEERLLNDLAGYIYQSETMYSSLQWVLDYFKKYDEQKSWKNLQIARASLAVARHYIPEYSLPEFKMTREDRMELMHREIDVSFMETLDTDFKDEQTTLNNTCLNLHYEIMDGVFLKDHWDLCMQHIAVLKELTACDIQYLANTADYVLASLDDETLAGKFYSLMDNYCPLTRACQAEVLETPEKIEEKNVELLDQIEDHLLERATIIGRHKNRRNILKDQLEKEDYTSLRENLTEISDLPVTAAYPAWYDDEDIVYYWKENGEELNMPAPGTTIERIPDGCIIPTKDVSKVDLLDYQAELEDTGLPSTASTEKDGKISILYQYNDSTFTINWEDGNVSILMDGSPVCLVPRWYKDVQEAIK